MDSFLVGTYVVTIGLYLLGSLLWVILSDDPTPRRSDVVDLWILTCRWLRDELDEDLADIREKSLLDHVVAAAETVLILGLAVRTGIHVLLYVIAAPGREPDSVRFGFAEAVSPRPAWHVALSTIVTACLFGWFVRGWLGLLGVGPTALIIETWLLVNLCASVHDVVALSERMITNITPMENTLSTNDEQHTNNGEDA
jgi:hypothetical protein